jgi:carboxymethylenebutenolidase
MALKNLPKRLNYLQRYLVEEYVEDYQEGLLTRRQALKTIAGLLGSVAAANALLAACTPVPAPQPESATAAPTAEMTADMAAEATVVATMTVLATDDTASTTPAPLPEGVTVSPDDPDISVERVSFPGDGFAVHAYLARPRSDGPYPAILVAHENRGLTPHIEDVARRLAKAGYVALAVDLLSPTGGYGAVSDPGEIPGLLGSTSPDLLAGQFLRGLEYLKTQPYVNPERFGMTGFCFGGGMTWLVATRAPELKAAVPFYGPNPPLADVPNIEAAVLAIYGEDDARINAGIPAIEATMQENGKTFEKIIYPGVGHAFHNDTGQRYDEAAAKDAWARTLAWFEQYVK